LWVLDPRRAAGMEAVVATELDGEHWLVSYGAAGSSRQATEDRPRAVDNSGTSYELVKTSSGHGLLARHGARTLPLGEVREHSSVRPSHDGTRVAVWTPEQVDLVDASGATRWQRTASGILGVVFAPDDRRLVVQTSGGVIVLDVATGEPVGVTCGWGFGLHDVAPPLQSFGITSACEEMTSP
jgi:hypothetical protein